MSSRLTTKKERELTGNVSVQYVEMRDLAVVVSSKSSRASRRGRGCGGGYTECKMLEKVVEVVDERGEAGRIVRPPEELLELSTK